MSFIYGIINTDGAPIHPEDIQALANAVKWENFTGQTWVEGAIGIGFCHHPERKPKAGIFKNEDLIVLTDIRLYRAQELKASFDFDTPEEAFAKAYLRWGVLCADHINGDFAAMVFDRRTKQAHLFRDHIGARPLCYWFSGNRLIFASQQFGLAKSGLFQTGLSEKKLIDSLFRYRAIYEQTVFEQILKVVPGHCISFLADGNHSVTKYWRPETIQKDTRLSFEAAVTGLRERIVKATTSRMEQGKTGLHISGGLDSCGIAAIVADHTPDKLQLTGYSWTPEVFDDPATGVNEKEFINCFCQDKRVAVKYLNLKENETVKNALLPEFEVQHIEHPVMQMAGKDGIETLFSGWGGDEFVSMSIRGTVNHLFFRFKWLRLLQYIREKGIRHTIGQFRIDVFPAFIPFGLLPAYTAGRTDWSVLHMLKPAFIRRHWQKIFLHKRKNTLGYGNRSRFMLNLLELHHLPERMDSWGIHAERYGFEYKYPLLDKDVLEFWFSIPVAHTYKDFQPRLLYREAMKGILTEKVRTRKDKGEALRIAFSVGEQQKGKKYLSDLFNSLRPKDHLPYFKTDAFKNVMEQPVSGNMLKNIRSTAMYILYLRYVALVKNYLQV